VEGGEEDLLPTGKYSAAVTHVSRAGLKKNLGFLRPFLTQKEHPIYISLLSHHFL